MRTILVGLTAFVMTVLLGPVVMVARLFRVPAGPSSIYAWSVRHWSRAITFAAGVRVRVHGEEWMRLPGGKVFVSNHVSWFDVFALTSQIPWCGFVAKAELRRIPLFGFAASAVGIVFIERDNRKAAFESYKLAAEEVNRGRGVVVCPEGTRGLDYHLRPFKKGPFVLAIASQAPIVPTVVFGAREVMPKGSFWIKPGVVDVRFLPPVPTAGLVYDDRAQLMITVWTEMADALRGMYGITTAEHPVANQA